MSPVGGTVSVALAAIVALMTARHRVLVTGGSGFIGTNMVERLRGAGVEVLNLDPSPPRHPDHHAVWRQADLRDGSLTADIVTELEPSHVVHLGARTDLTGETLADYSSNTEGTRNLVGALQHLAKPPRLVVASTRMVCPIGYQPRSSDDYNPPNAYGESKVLTEQIVRQAGYTGTWCLVRPTSIWGPWFGVPYRDFFLAVKRGRYRHPAGRAIRKSFGYVGNTVHQLTELLFGLPDESVHRQLFYLADYEPIEVLQWAHQIQAEMGGPPVSTVPLAVLRFAARAGDVLKSAGWAEPPLTSFRLGNLITEMVYDTDSLEKLVPELPFDAGAGVRLTAEWFAEFGSDPPSGDSS